MCMHVSVSMYVYLCEYVGMCVSVCMSVCVLMCVYVSVCVCMCARVSVYCVCYVCVVLCCKIFLIIRCFGCESLGRMFTSALARLSNGSFSWRDTQTRLYSCPLHEESAAGPGPMI